MTIAQQLRQKGMQAGIEETAINLLMANVNEDVVKKATGLSSEKLNELKRKKPKN